MENKHWSLISLLKVHPHFITLFLLPCIGKAFRPGCVLSFPLSSTDHILIS